MLPSENFIEVNEELLKLAKDQCTNIHSKVSSNDLKDYPKNPGPLCKWRNGQCDFYDICFGQKKLDEFVDIKTLEEKGL